MGNSLADFKVAILVTDGFEQSEFEEPQQALKEEGATVDVVSLKKGTVKAWKDDNWGEEFEATQAIADVNADDYDALVLPGGVMNPDKLRVDDKAVAFVKTILSSNKPVAAICHAPWTLVETGLLNGRTLTSYKTLKTDLTNAGATWEDKEVVTDRNLITSRSPKDLPAFCKAVVEKIAASRSLQQ